MKYKLDAIDREIISLLQEDGRMPCAEIARRMGNVTERVVRLRIDRLTEKGIIKISAFVVAKSVGFSIMADVWVEVEADQVMEVGQKLTRLEEISYVACSTGDSNISVQVSAVDITELYRFVTNVIGKIPGVKRTTITVLPIILKDIHEWALPRSTLTFGKEG